MSHNPNPLPLTASEWDEIIGVDVVRELWGLDPDKTGETFSQRTYAAKFDFVSGVGPGSGIVYIIMGDTFEGPPVVLRRDEQGKLEHIRFPN